MIDSDMFEHADGNDTVISAGFDPVVAQVESHPVG